MPEGPEIRRAADKIAKAIAGEKLEEVFFAFPHLEEYMRKLAGKTVRAVETRGKAMLVRIERCPSIYSHNQLYGRWYVRKRDSYPTTNRQLRMALHTKKHSALLYSASDIEVLDRAGEKAHAFLSKLGPDVLDPKLTPSAVAKRFDQKRFRGRRLATLLLDQGFLCGTGNYLRSESLFVAGIPPFARPKDLDDSERIRLARATLDMCRRAYRTGGVTNDSRSVAELKARGQPRSQYRYFVFGRAGQPCRQCGETIERIDTSGRRIYICPYCQPEL